MTAQVLPVEGIVAPLTHISTGGIEDAPAIPPGHIIRAADGAVIPAPPDPALFEGPGWQRRWAGFRYGGGERLIMRINLPLLGVSLNPRAMIADLTATTKWNYRHNLEWVAHAKKHGEQPLGVDESGSPNRGWVIGPAGLMRYDLAIDDYQPMTPEQIAETNLLHGYHDLMAALMNPHYKGPHPNPDNHPDGWGFGATGWGNLGAATS